MGNDDLDLNGLSSSATGILECLRMLADEAAELQLDDTLRALREAIEVCQSERDKVDPLDEAHIGAPPHAILH